MISSHTLSDTPVGQKVRLVAISGSKKLTRRLLSMGLSVGSELEVLHHRGHGVVVAKQGNRVALDKNIAGKMHATNLD